MKVNLSEYRIQSKQDDLDLNDHWISVLHLSCGERILGDGESYRRQISADQVWHRMLQHRCKTSGSSHDHNISTQEVHGPGDARGWYRGCCSCGEYVSAPCSTEQGALKCAADHKKAKEEKPDARA